MDMKETADVSRFMLFEASGDSEADADPIMDQQSAAADDDDYDDDDAESCSYEGSENQNSNLGDQQLGGYEPCAPDAEYEHHDGKMTHEEEACVYGTSYCDDDEVQKRQHKSSLSGESGQQLMDEMEKNRRFWEACLAS